MRPIRARGLFASPFRREVLRAAGKGGRLHRSYTALLGAVCGGLTLGAVFCWFWGADYYTDTFQEQSGIYAQPVAAEDLLRVTLHFARQAVRTADSVERDENGVFAVKT